MAKFLGTHSGDFIPGTRDFKLDSYIVFQSDTFCWKEVDGNMWIRKTGLVKAGEGWSYEWRIPRGSVVNGASIPRGFMWLVGSPFDRGRRLSSAIHDVMCQEKRIAYRVVHELFDEMVRHESNNSWRGKLMGWAVMKFGPRW